MESKSKSMRAAFMQRQRAPSPSFGQRCLRFVLLTDDGIRHKLSAVQLTIQIDDGLLAQATKLAREKGCDLSRLIEDTRCAIKSR